jgi:hypothetical protein
VCLTAWPHCAGSTATLLGFACWIGQGRCCWHEQHTRYRCAARGSARAASFFR